jgi:hypothetical protein
MERDACALLVGDRSQEPDVGVAVSATSLIAALGPAVIVVPVGSGMKCIGTRALWVHDTSVHSSRHEGPFAPGSVVLLCDELGVANITDAAIGFLATGDGGNSLHSIANGIFLQLRIGVRGAGKKRYHVELVRGSCYHQHIQNASRAAALLIDHLVPGARGYFAGGINDEWRDE